jgi:hypothetical protein
MSLAAGILVHGGNHFVVRGRRPSREEALALARHWSMIRIGSATPAELAEWRISTREFRENLSWAAVVPGGGDHTEAVAQLLAELAGRGIPVDLF